MVYGGWPAHIQSNMKNGQGEKCARKLTMLEGVAALATLCASPAEVSGRELTVDQLSKAKFYEAGVTAGTQVNLCKVPRTLLKWLECPVVTCYLGLAMLEEIQDEGVPVLPMEPESRAEIAALKCSRPGAAMSWRKISSS